MEKNENYLKVASTHGTAWRGHGNFAIKLVETLKPLVTVELGVEYGYSSFCFGYPRIGKVYGVDWFKGDVTMGMKSNPELTKIALLEVYDKIKNQFGVNNIEFIESEFNDLAKTWDKEIDLLHIDGLHDYDNCKNDCDTWAPLLKENGVILFHDTVSNPDGVGLFFSQLEVPKVNFTNSCGLGVASNNSELIEEIGRVFNV